MFLVLGCTGSRYPCLLSEFCLLPELTLLGFGVFQESCLIHAVFHAVFLSEFCREWRPAIRASTCWPSPRMRLHLSSLLIGRLRHEITGNQMSLGNFLASRLDEGTGSLSCVGAVPAAATTAREGIWAGCIWAGRLAIQSRHTVWLGVPGLLVLLQ